MAGGEVVVGAVEGGVTVGWGCLLPFLRVVFLRWGPSSVCGPSVAVGVCVVCQGLGPLEGGNPDALGTRLLATPPGDEVHNVLVEAFIGMVKLPRTLPIMAVQLSCRRYQPTWGKDNTSETLDIHYSSTRA